jgi:preprotein translocase SecE subunit
MDAHRSMESDLNQSGSPEAHLAMPVVSPQARWLSFAFLSASALVGFLVYSLLLRAGSLWELEAKLRPYKISFDLLLPVASVLAGVVTYVILGRHRPTREFSEEVVHELSEVTWPAPTTVRGNTVVVVVMVIVSAILLGLLDRLWTAVIGAIL